MILKIKKHKWRKLWTHNRLFQLLFLLSLWQQCTEKVHRALAAVAGATLLLACKILDVESLASYIDFNTVGILIGMMLFVSVVKISGLFEYIAIKAAKLSKGKPWIIMILFFIITAVLSAFLDNVTTVLLVGPMTIAVTEMLGLNPVPFLITQILASNVGGTATLIGDPPNIMIGSAAGLSFNDFIVNTGVPAVIIGVLTLFCFYFIYGRKLHVTPEKMAAVMELDENKAIKDKVLLIQSVVVMICVVVAFMLHDALGIQSATIAIAAAAVILFLSHGKADPEEIIATVEWPTIVFFVGLFGVVGGLQQTGVIDMMAKFLINVTQGNDLLMLLLILWVSAILSSFLDNIPFVATQLFHLLLQWARVVWILHLFGGHYLLVLVLVVMVHLLVHQLTLFFQVSVREMDTKSHLVATLRLVSHL